MVHVATYEFLRALKDALTQPERSRHWPMDEWAGRAVVDGWCTLTDVSDVMEQQDPRIYLLERHMKAACVTFGIPVRNTVFRPSSPNSQMFLFEGLSVLDTTALMVAFEQLGFAIDPSPLVGLIAGRLAEQQRLSLEEARLTFYDRLRAKAEVTLVTQERPTIGRSVRMRTSAGYRIDWLETSGSAARLSVRGPRYRAMPARVEQTCEYCHFTYTQGDLDSSREHRRFHVRVEHCFDPVASARLSRRIEELGASAYRVDESSPKWAHKEVYERAVMFKREMEFDFIQWESPPARGRVKEQAVGYLLCPPGASSTIAGACAFRDRDGVWTMDWAWLAPKFRRLGLMRDSWSRLVEAFGDFPLETPLSDSMQAFVTKHGTPAQIAACVAASTLGHE